LVTQPEDPIRAEVITLTSRTISPEDSLAPSSVRKTLTSANSPGSPICSPKPLEYGSTPD
jgi:hypothetical protein